jgi:RNA polymerase sigma-70 factor (ECF subfamily)
MFRLTRSVPDAEDITQEVFVRLWGMRENIDPERNFPSLLFTIARRLAVDLYRSRGRLHISSSDKPEDGVSQEKSPRELLEEREANLLLDIAIGSMSPKQREVFSMHYYQNLSPRDIAALTGLSYDNVRRQIYNAKRQLCAEAILK